MDRGAVYKKTQKGLEEMARRTVLGMRERALLIMVDGKTTAADLLVRAQHMPDPQGLLEKLIDGGFIVADTSGAATPALAPTQSEVLSPQDRAIMQNTIRYAERFLDQTLGPDADALAEAFGKCKTLSELRTRLEKTRDVIEGMGKKRKSEEFWTTAQALLEGRTAPEPATSGRPAMASAPPAPPGVAVPPPSPEPAASPAAPLSSIQEAVRFARRFLHDNLGPDADILLEPIEKCKTAAELFNRMEKTREAIVGFTGKRKAEEFWNGVLPRLPKL